jgi:guanylate kinase
MSVITLTGPTCAGKSTIERELQRLGCGRAISHTTRAPRAGEKDGHHYFFIDDVEYDRLATAGAFVETVELGTRRYAMSKMALKQAQQISLNVAIVVEPHGAAQIRKYCLANDMPVFSVWVDCGAAEQARRFLARMTGDMVIGKETIRAYEERLQLMLTEEASWRARAAINVIMHGEANYDKRIDSSERYAPKELAGLILHSLSDYGFDRQKQS